LSEVLHTYPIREMWFCQSIAGMSPVTIDNEGISIPFPQRDIHLYEEKAS
jgi:hypothetical protein